jgi:tetratricopeptide (TPR) repeat protein
MRKRLLLTGIFLILTVTITGCGMAGADYREGKRNFIDGEYEKAAGNFQTAIAKNPDRADYYIDYGMSLIALGRCGEALAQFDLAYMDKDLPIVKKNNKRVLRGKGIAYYRMLQYEKAVEEFKPALEMNVLSELDMDILYYMAAALKTTGAYEEAIKTYTDILSIDDDNALAYAERAGCYKWMGDYEKSLADYESAISLEPDNYEYYFGKYYLLAENGNEAAAVLAQAEEIEASAPEDKYNLAKLHLFQGKYDAALSELNGSYAEGFKESYYYIGELYRMQKDYEKAIYYYKNYITDGQITSSNVYNQLAVCLIKTGGYEEALDYLEQGMEYNNAGTMRYFKKNEIIAYEKLGRFQDANQKIGEYLDSYPEDAQALREAGFIEARILPINTEGGNE